MALYALRTTVADSCRSRGACAGPKDNVVRRPRLANGETAAVGLRSSISPRRGPSSTRSRHNVV